MLLLYAVTWTLLTSPFPVTRNFMMIPEKRILPSALIVRGEYWGI